MFRAAEKFCCLWVSCEHVVWKLNSFQHVSYVFIKTKLHLNCFYSFIWTPVLQVLYWAGYAQHSLSFISRVCFLRHPLWNFSERLYLPNIYTDHMNGRPHGEKSSLIHLQLYQPFQYIEKHFSGPRALQWVSILHWNGTKLKGYAAQCHENIYLIKTVNKSI